LAQAITHILPQNLKPDTGAAVTHCLFDLLDTAAVGQGSAVRFARRHSRGDPFVRKHFRERANLFVELSLHPLPVKQIAEDCLKV
jgi:hypothetical protein